MWDLGVWTTSIESLVVIVPLDDNIVIKGHGSFEIELITNPLCDSDTHWFVCFLLPVF